LPRHFTEDDREKVRNRLLEVGTELFQTHGYKKTAIDDVVRRVGVSKGTFYAFFSGKEDYFVEILLTAERHSQEIIQETLFSSGLPMREAFVESMYAQLMFIQNTPILHVLSQPEEFQFLTERLQPEQINRLFEHDREYIAQLLDEARRQTTVRDVELESLTGLLRGVSMLVLHQREIGADVFSRSLRLLLTMIADYLFPSPGGIHD